jgi:outer membrane protein/protease secretion system outer membrane protein
VINTTQADIARQGEINRNQINANAVGAGAFGGSRQAVAEQTRAEESLEALRRDLGVRVHKEYRGVSEGVMRVKALEQAARSAEQMMKSTQMSLKAGSRTQLDVLNAQQQYTLALRDLATARFVYLLSNVRLASLVGDDAMDSVEKVNASLILR